MRKKVTETFVSSILCGGCIYADHHNCGTDRGAAASENLADLE